MANELSDISMSSGVYCRSARQPQYPVMDVRLVMEQIQDSKGLIISAMEELKKSR